MIINNIDGCTVNGCVNGACVDGIARVHVILDSTAVCAV